MFQFIPFVGFVDDTMVIVYALYKIKAHIDDSIKQKAHERMTKIFGENYDGNNEIEGDFKPEKEV